MKYVVESNSLNSLITLHTCDDDASAKECLWRIRKNYLDSEGYNSEELIKEAKERGIVENDEAESFIILVEGEDYELSVQILNDYCVIKEN